MSKKNKLPAPFDIQKSVKKQSKTINRIDQKLFDLEMKIDTIEWIVDRIRRPLSRSQMSAFRIGLALVTALQIAAAIKILLG